MKNYLLALFVSIPTVWIATDTSPSLQQSHTKQELTARQIVRQSVPSVVVIESEDIKGKPLALGSGFFVGKDIVATNYHVIEGASRLLVKIVGSTQIYKVQGTVGIDKDIDLVLLKASEMNGRPLRIGNSEATEAGDIVYVIGNPDGLEGSLSHGIVSAKRGYDLLQITAPISPGSSGGPVLNIYGEVIGIATAYLKEGQNLNFALTISRLQPLLENAQTVSPLPLPSTFKNISPSQTETTSEHSVDVPTDFPKAESLPRIDYGLPSNSKGISVRDVCEVESIPSDIDVNTLKSFGKLLKAGNAYLQQGRYADAAGIFKVASESKPNNAEAWYYLSVSYSRIRICYSKAWAAIEHAVLLSPRNALYIQHREALKKHN